MPKKKTLKAMTTLERLVSRPAHCVNEGQAPTYYANRLEIGFSNYDFRLRLQEIINATQEMITAKELAVLYLTPAHAKVVAELFLKQVGEYEKLFGPIPKPVTPDRPISKE